jgi:hypothetical protein
MKVLVEEFEGHWSASLRKEIASSRSFEAPRCSNEFEGHWRGY